MSEHFSVKGKTVLITGAASGVGRALACCFAKHPVQLILFDINSQGLDETKQRVEEAGGQVECFKVDVSNAQEIDNTLDRLSKPVDVLINLAAILLYKPMLDTTAQDWDRVLNTNLKGTFLMSQRVAHNMIKHNIKGSIINVSSACGSRAQNDVIAYGSAKSGLVILTKNTALELTAHGIRVNCVAPGIMLTPMMEDVWDTPRGQALLDAVPMKRAADVSELMGIFLLLSGDHSSYMTGAIIEIDGGLCCAELRT